MSGYKDLESGGSKQASALVNEAFGTFFISLALFAGVSGWSALAVGGAVAFFSWFEKAGQYNAAVTLSNCVGKNPSMGLMAGIMCIVAQVVGALLAVLFSGFLMGGSASIPGGSLSSGFSDLFLTLVLLYTFAKNNKGLDLGLAYYSGLTAFPSALGANASVVLGVLVGNAILGSGLSLGMDLVWAAGAPIAAGVLFPFLGDITDKIPRSGELLGTFFFALLAFAIGFDNAFAVGTSLHTVSNMFPGNYNPALTLAAWAKGGFNVSVIADPVFDIVAQVIGTFLAVVVGGFVGTTASIPAAAAVGPPAVLEIVFGLILGLTYVSNSTTLTKGLAYFAVTTAFASSFNTAFSLGLYVAGLGGFGSGSLDLTALVDPLIAGLAAGFLHGKFANLNELVGTALLFVVVGSTTDRLALGAAFVALHTIYGGSFNPALTFAQSGVDVNTFLLQFGGAAIGGLAATFAGAADGAGVSAGGLSDGGKSLVAELLFAAVLIKTYERNGDDHTSTGLSLFALLSIFGAAAGSLANPALVLGNWLGGGILGGGFDFGVNALIGLVGHLAMPFAGAVIAPTFFSLPGKLMLDKASLSSDEFFGSFLAVLAAAGVAEGETLAYALALMTIYNIVTTGTDIFPLVSAYRDLGSGDPVAGLVSFLKKLAAQALGAIVAGLVAGWLFAGAARRLEEDGAGMVIPDRRRLQVDLPPGLINGLLLGLLFAWGFDYAKTTLDLAITYFTAVTVFSGVDVNGAKSLATALVGAATGGGVGFATDLAWWTAFLAPVVGGILAGRLAPLLGK